MAAAFQMVRAFVAPPVMLRSQLHLVSEDAPTQWVHAASVGLWQGHPDGAFEITAVHLAQAVKNFEANPDAIPFTYDHPTYDGTPREKSGWCHGLKVKGDELWALGEFTEKAVKLNRGGSYKKCSIVFHPESIDRRTNADIGFEVFEIALTDTPWIDSLTPIQLARQLTNKRIRIVKPNTIKLALDLDAVKKSLDLLEGDVTAEQIMAVVEAEIKKQAALEGPADPAPDADPAPLSNAPADATALQDPPPVDEAVAAEEEALLGEMQAVVGSLAEMLQLDTASTVAAMRDNLEAVAGAMSGGGAEVAEPASDVVGMSQENSALKTQLAHLATKLDTYEKREKDDAETKAASDAKSKVDALIQCGRIKDDEGPGLIQFARENPAGFDAMAKVLKPAIPTARVGGNGSGRREVDVTELSAKDKRYAKLTRKAMAHSKKPKDEIEKIIAERLAERASARDEN